MKNRVMVGCPIRNRAWILPRYIDNLMKFYYDPHKLEFAFIINDCTDNTLQLLKEFQRRNTSPVHLMVDESAAKHGHRRGQYNLSRLADLRNMLLQVFLGSDCDYLFSVDSDILVPPAALSRLVGDDCTVVSALVCNGGAIGNDKIYNILSLNSCGNYVHRLDFPRDQVFQVDCTGAAYLIRRDVIVQGVRYNSRRGAEDIGFCEEARNQGINIYCDGRIECIHVMNEPDRFI